MPERINRVWYIANCLDCDMKMPFTSYEDRAQWVGEHRVGTGHKVEMFLEAS